MFLINIIFIILLFYCLKFLIDKYHESNNKLLSIKGEFNNTLINNITDISKYSNDNFYPYLFCDSSDESYRVATFIKNNYKDVKILDTHKIGNITENTQYLPIENENCEDYNLLGSGINLSDTIKRHYDINKYYTYNTKYYYKQSNEQLYFIGNYKYNLFNVDAISKDPELLIKYKFYKDSKNVKNDILGYTILILITFSLITFLSISLV